MKGPTQVIIHLRGGEERGGGERGGERESEERRGREKGERGYMITYW